MIDPWATGMTFRAGPRIRLQITSGSFPRWERNLNTGESSVHSSRARVAHRRIFYDPARPSHLTLTVVDG